MSDDKELIRKIIFGNYREKAIEICKVLRKNNMYDGWSGFGKYLAEARCIDSEKTDEVARKLNDILDGQNEETHHVWLVLQEVTKYLSATQDEEFKEKVEKQ